MVCEGKYKQLIDCVQYFFVFVSIKIVFGYFSDSLTKVWNPRPSDVQGWRPG
jgi:hypothetical protein